MTRVRTALFLWALAVSPALAAAPARLATSLRPGEALRAGETTTLRLGADQGVEEMEVLLSLDGGRSFSLRVTREMPPGTREVTWRVPNLPTTRARLALRARDAEEGEVIRSISDEFTILPGEAEPLEVLRAFRGEWRAGDALDEVPSSAPLDAPGLGGATESLRAVHHETDLERTDHAGLGDAPPGGGAAPAEPVRLDPPSAPDPARIPIDVPRRE